MSKYSLNNTEFLSTSVVENDILGLSKECIESLKSIRSSTILVTGASGFLASSLIFYILKLSIRYDLQIKVIALARNIDRLKNRISSLDYKMFEDNLSIVSYQVEQDISSEYKSDFVLHTASNADPLSFSKDSVGTCLANTLGTIKSLDYAKSVSAYKYIYFSTSGVYGHMNPEDYPLSEDKFGPLNPTQPENIYLMSKKMAECLISAESKNFTSLNYNIVRPSITYGPGLNLSDVRSMPYFIKSALLGNDIRLKSKGSSYRNFLYIKDFVEAIILCMASPTSDIFNVASSVDTKIVDLAHLFCQASKFNITTIIENNENSNLNRVEFNRTTTSQKKIQSILHWTESTMLTDGINKTLDHYRSLL